MALSIQKGDIFFYFLSIEFWSWCEQPSISTFSASFDWPMKQYMPIEQHEGESFVHTLFVFHLSLSRLVGQEKKTNQKNIETKKINKRPFTCYAKTKDTRSR